MIGFRDINKNLLKPDSKVGLKQIKDLIFNSDNDNIKKTI